MGLFHSSKSFGEVLDPWPFARCGSRLCYAYSEADSPMFVEVLERDNSVFNVGADQKWCVVDIDDCGFVRFGERVSVLLKELSAGIRHRYSKDSVYMAFAGDSQGFVKYRGSDSSALVGRVYNNFMDGQYPLENKACFVASLMLKKVPGFLFRASDERGSYELVVFPSSYEIPVGQSVDAEFMEVLRSLREVVVEQVFTQQTVNSLHFFFRHCDSDLNVSTGFRGFEVT